MKQVDELLRLVESVPKELMAWDGGWSRKYKPLVQRRASP